MVLLGRLVFTVKLKGREKVVFLPLIIISSYQGVTGVAYNDLPIKLFSQKCGIPNPVDVFCGRVVIRLAFGLSVALYIPNPSDKLLTAVTSNAESFTAVLL